ARQTLEHSAEKRTALRLPADYFLASARFTEKKNLPGLLRAYARYRDRCQENRTGDAQSPWELVVLGDGPGRQQLEQLRDELGLSERVRLPGFQQYDVLSSYYAFARAFVHASTVEQWGLVVNEAMASGLPILLSNRCGCASMLLDEGVNGYLFDPEDREA